MSIKFHGGDRLGLSWWARFDVDNKNDRFCGQILHIHLETPDVWKDVVKTYLDWGAKANAVAIGVGMLSASVASLALPVAAGLVGASENQDKSYDFFFFIEYERPKVFESRFSPRWQKLYFAGFVSDQPFKPPVGLSIGGISFIDWRPVDFIPTSMLFSMTQADLVRNYRRIRSLAKEYRSSPNPD